jgi:endonuclease/exonuclease/phosphatase (EEP) superfamily protein YafD
MFAVAGLALVTVFAVSARIWWAFDVFSHFRLQYSVIALVLCGAAFAVRAYPSTAVLAAVALVHGWAIKDLWVGGSAEAGFDGTPVRVASANVRKRNPAPEEVLNFVRDSDADVMVLVDARGKRWRDVLWAIGADYLYRAPEGWRDGAQVILFSRYPIVRDAVIRSPQGRRPYLAASLALDDHRLTVVDASSPSPTDPSDTRQRNLQLGYLANIVEGAEGPMIVVGDFNTTPWSPHFRDFVATAGLRNAANGHGYIATWPRRFWPAQIPIDHILVKGPVAVAKMGRGPSVGSDHYPIIADLRLVGG